MLYCQLFCCSINCWVIYSANFADVTMLCSGGTASTRRVSPVSFSNVACAPVRMGGPRRPQLPSSSSKLEDLTPHAAPGTATYWRDVGCDLRQIADCFQACRLAPAPSTAPSAAPTVLSVMEARGVALQIQVHGGAISILRGPDTEERAPAA